MNYQNNIKKINMKPNLIDPLIEQKIIKTLNPPIENYWGPAKDNFNYILHNYIKPNIFIFVLLVLFILFLVYRYKNIRQARIESKNDLDPNINLIDKPIHQVQTNQPLLTSNSLFVNPKSKSKIDHPLNQKEIDQYSELLIHLYQNQKESLREPYFKHYSRRMRPAQPSNPKLAYPMYPYVKNGSLSSKNK